MKEEKQKKKRSKKEAQVQVTLLDDTKQVFSVRVSHSCPIIAVLIDRSYYIVFIANKWF